MVGKVRQRAGASKQQQAYDSIKTAIERGSLVPGQRLVIDTLASQLKMSQLPIREAIRRLEAESLVEFTKNSGAVVAPVSAEVWADQMRLLAVLEGYLTGAVAPRITAEDIDKLVAINEAMALALEQFDLAAWSQGNLDFHQVINDRFENKIIVEQISKLRPRIETIARFVFSEPAATILHTLGPKSGQNTIAAHNWVIDGYRRGVAPEKIEMQVRNNILRLTEETLATLKLGA